MPDEYKKHELGMIGAGIAGMVIGGAGFLYSLPMHLKYRSERNQMRSNASKINNYDKEAVRKYNQRLIDVTKKGNYHVFGGIGCLVLGGVSGGVLTYGKNTRQNRLKQERKTQRNAHPRKL